jgi:hypothetical protein
LRFGRITALLTGNRNKLVNVGMAAVINNDFKAGEGSSHFVFTPTSSNPKGSSSRPEGLDPYVTARVFNSSDVARHPYPPASIVPIPITRVELLVLQSVQ